MNTTDLTAYNAATAVLGFGLHSAAHLLNAGLTWGQIHRLTDAGLLRVERLYPGLTGNHAVIYKAMFP